MSATFQIAQSVAREGLSDLTATVHDAWMEEGSRLFEAFMSPDATFWERWAAVNYLRSRFPERLDTEQQLLNELQSFLRPAVRSTVRMQGDRVVRLHQELQRLSDGRARANDMARVTRALLEAVRLWYAEVELAVGGIRLQALSTSARRALDGFRCGSALGLG